MPTHHSSTQRAGLLGLSVLNTLRVTLSYKSPISMEILIVSVNRMEANSPHKQEGDPYRLHRQGEDPFHLCTQDKSSTPHPFASVGSQMLPHV
jgi:hypothetical protein